ncbi:MAG: hypothetical protein GXC70_02000 [Sphingomonadaceae bacterium]|nr:hypothetical protein [Sphingomonadaceae bacterium]
MSLLTALSAVWSTPGLSEFASAALGGSITMLAQYLAIRHDRIKERKLVEDRKKALTWAIFFKIKEIFEALTHIRNDIIEAEKRASQSGLELWQVYQVPLGEFPRQAWEVDELMILIDNKHFDLMQNYQMATLWLSNVVDSTNLYRQMRTEFLLSTPARVDGTHGAIEMSQEEAQVIMPKIAHLRSLSASIADVIKTQQPEVRNLLESYVRAMRSMAGSAPQLELPAKP